MKRILIFSSAIPITLLLSFTLQPKGFKKIGTNLYTVTNSKAVSADDKEQLKKIIADRYGIKDFSKDVLIGPNNPVNAKGGWILNKSFWVHFISTKFIKWDKKAILPDEVKNVQAIIAKYDTK